MGKARDMDEVPTGQGDKGKKPVDLVEVVELKNQKFTAIRPFGPIYSYGGHWINGKAKKDGAPIKFYTPCAAWDQEENKRKGTYGSEYCAWCKHEQYQYENRETLDQKDKISRFAQDHWQNVIQRSIQKKGPPGDAGDPTKKEVKSGFKDKDSDTWTPVRAMRYSQNLLQQVQELKQLNNQENENGELQSFGVGHPKCGCDVQIMKDEAKPPAQYYSVQKGDPSPLKKSEKSYLIWDLSAMANYPTTEEMEADYRKTLIRMGKDPDEILGGGKSKKKGKKVEEDDEDIDEDDDDVPKSKKKTASKKVDDDEDDDEDEAPKKKSKKPAFDDSDDEEDEDEAPKSKKKTSKKVDEDDDEDEEDDPPPKKKAPAKKKPADDDDDDEEDDPPPKKRKAPPPDDDDDEEDEAPKKKKPVKKSKDEDDDEDEEDDPPPKSKKKAKPVDDDDEDEDEAPKAKKKKAPPKDEDDEDEEDDDPPPKKQVPAKKTAKKKSSDDDDDEDDL